MNLEESASNEMSKEFRHIGKFMSTSMRKMSKILDHDYDVDYDLDYRDFI